MEPSSLALIGAGVAGLVVAIGVAVVIWKVVRMAIRALVVAVLVPLCAAGAAGAAWWWLSTHG